jgi:hypothetical protein
MVVSIGFSDDFLIIIVAAAAKECVAARFAATRALRSLALNGES